MLMRTTRTRTGALADLGPVLWFLLLCCTFPLLNLATIGLRYTFLLGASRDAAQVASEAKTFQSDISASSLSSIDAANQQATTSCNSFTGIHLQSCQTNLIVTNIAADSSTKQTTALTTPADTGTYLYQVEVVLTAKVDPLLTYSGPIFGNIPALTGPATYVVASQQVAENPQGLNQ